MNKQALAMSVPQADATEKGPDHLTVSPAPTSVEERDYLAEAFRIIGGKTMLLAQREHLIAFYQYHQDTLLQIASRLGEKA